MHSLTLNYRENVFCGISNPLNSFLLLIFNFSLELELRTEYERKLHQIAKIKIKVRRQFTNLWIHIYRNLKDIFTQQVYFAFTRLTFLTCVNEHCVWIAGDPWGNFAIIRVKEFTLHLQDAKYIPKRFPSYSCVDLWFWMLFKVVSFPARIIFLFINTSHYSWSFALLWFWMLFEVFFFSGRGDSTFLNISHHSFSFVHLWLWLRFFSRIIVFHSSFSYRNHVPMGFVLSSGWRDVFFTFLRWCTGRFIYKRRVSGHILIFSFNMWQMSE